MTHYFCPSLEMPEIYLYRQNIASADTVEKLEALLPWNVELKPDIVANKASFCNKSI